MILALAGGVGGAKLASGLARCLAADRLTVAVNTGDDFEHLGLKICPDLDTVMYWLSGRNDPVRGWGTVDETWNFMAALKELGAPAWFQLGDRDMATHIERTRRLNAGETLSAVTAHLFRQLGVEHRVVPMSDDPVRTFVTTEHGRLEFQDYFVRHRAEPKIMSVEYEGASRAAPSAVLSEALQSTALDAIVICPSNPVLSVQPILAVGRVRDALAAQEAPKVAVSPIIGGRAVKGPAARNLTDLGIECSALGIARYYRGLIDGIVIDEQDRELSSAIEALGMAVMVTTTLMTDEASRVRLAEATLGFARELVQAA